MSTTIKRASEYVTDAYLDDVCYDGQCYHFGPNESKSFQNHTVAQLVAAGCVTISDTNKDKPREAPYNKL